MDNITKEGKEQVKRLEAYQDAEEAAMEAKKADAVNDVFDFMVSVETLTASLPNDFHLGRAVRKLVNKL